MPALTTTAATQVTTQKRDGRAFDEVSDAVDEGRCTVSTSLIHPKSSDRTPRLQ